MIFITPKLYSACQKEDKKFNLGNLVNQKEHTVAATPLSYRQINTLSRDNLFPEERDSKKNWRKFSLKELIYFEIVYELKKFGISHNILKSLSDSFFQDPSSDIELEANKYTSETAIICTLIQAEIMLTVMSNGKIAYYDPPHYLLLGREETPAIQIRLNDVLNTVNKKIKKSGVPIKWSGRNYLWNREGYSVSDTEKEVLKVLRDKSYNTVKLKTKDGKVSLIRAGKVIDPKLSNTELEKLIKAKEYQEIELITENGKIVSYKVEEKIKL